MRDQAPALVVFVAANQAQHVGALRVRRPNAATTGRMMGKLRVIELERLLTNNVVVAVDSDIEFGATKGAIRVNKTDPLPTQDIVSI